jgi:hypothetical protein
MTSKWVWAVSALAMLFYFRYLRVEDTSQQHDLSPAPKTKAVPVGPTLPTQSKIATQGTSVEKRNRALAEVPTERQVNSTNMEGLLKNPKVQVFSVTASISRVVYPVAEYLRLYPNAEDAEELRKNLAKVDSVIEAVSKYDEPKIPVSQLTVNCPVLNSLTDEIVMRINSSGYVLEAATLDGSAQVPNQIYQCEFKGGPNSLYMIDYIPPENPTP